MGESSAGGASPRTEEAADRCARLFVGFEFRQQLHARRRSGRSTRVRLWRNHALLPRIAQRNGAIEHGPIGRVVFDIGNEITVTLELKTFLRPGLREQWL